MNMKKNFIWNTIGTTFNAFNSLFYMIIVTRINGIDDAGIFTFAFSLACLFYVIGVYSGRSYQVTEIDKNISESDYFYTKILTCVLMIIIAIIFCLINKYNFYKFLVVICLVIYKALEAFSEFSYAVIQKEEKLYQVGISLFLKSIFSLFFFFIFDILFKNLVVACTFIIVINLLIILLYDIPSLKKTSLKISKIKRSNVVKLLRKGFYAFGFTFLTLYVINASKYAMDGILSDNYQTIFGIIIMPATVLILFSQYVIQPFVVKLKNLLSHNLLKFKKLITKLIISIVVIGIITILIAYMIGIPILNLLYGLKLDKYLNDLLIILFGATCYAITNIISTALTTMRYTLNQLIIFIVTSIFTFLLSRYLIGNYGIDGATFSYLSSMINLLVLYLISYRIALIKFKKRYKESK